MSTTSRAIHSTSDEQTERIGAALAPCLQPGTVVALHGDLGTGKTVMSRGVARGLGIRELVTSPTFTVVQEYLCPGDLWLFHLDMYRIDTEEAALAFGIEEYLYVPNAVTLVEWPERIEGLFGDDERTHRIWLSHGDDGGRRILLPNPLANMLPDTTA